MKWDISYFGLLLGLKPKALKIMPMGLSIEFEVSKEEYNKRIEKANKFQRKKMWIAVAGPVTNILIILLLGIVKEKISNILYQEMIYANLLICLFNLLPIYPLDGARILKAIIHIKKGGKRANEIANFISNISMVLLTMFASIAIYYYKNVAILFVIIYLWSMVIIENRRYRLRKRIDKILENA